jgi:hypothetical protein
MKEQEPKTEFKLEFPDEKEIFDEEFMLGGEIGGLYDALQKERMQVAKRIISGINVEIREGIDISLNGVDRSRLYIGIYEVLDAHRVYFEEMMTDKFWEDHKEESLDSMNDSIYIIKRVVEDLETLMKEHDKPGYKAKRDAR